jgi:hypothetical protein
MVAARFHAPAHHEGRPFGIGGHGNGARYRRTAGLPGDSPCLRVDCPRSVRCDPPRAQWLLDWKAAGTYQWPTSVSGDELDAAAARSLTGRQDAWCYGTPGISAALDLASQALGDDGLGHVSDRAIASLASRPASTWDADGPALCHGHAGVLQCAASRHSSVAAQAADAITAAFDASRPFAIPHTDNGTIGDRPGFLTGAAGAALALAEHDRLPSPAVPARWDCVLLLS